MKELKGINKQSLGGLSFAKNLTKVLPEDYIDGMGIIDKNPQVLYEDELLQPDFNTRFAYYIGLQDGIVKKRKIYQVVIDVTGMTSCNIVFSFTRANAYIATLSAAFVTADTPATLYTNIVTAFAGNAQLAGTIFTHGIVGNVLTMTLDNIYFGYEDYLMTVASSNSTGIVTYVPLFDAISQDKTGKLKPIRFSNVVQDQQGFATTGINHPVTYQYAISADATGKTVTIQIADTFPQLDNDEEVYIVVPAGVAKAYSGFWTLTNKSHVSTNYVYNLVAVINPTTHNLPTASVDTFAFVTRYFRTLSVVFYATKNVNNGDVWAYTELLKSANLNFRTYRQIQDANIKQNNEFGDGVVYDWCDFLNVMRRLIYQGEIMTNGFLTAYNPDALYNLDTIELESRLQTGTNTADVSLFVTNSGSTQSGVQAIQGAKPEASYCASVYFLSEDGTQTTFATMSNVVWTHSNDLIKHTYGVITDMALQINIDNIPQGIFTHIQVAIIEFSTSSQKGYLLPAQPITGSSKTIIDTGKEPQFYALFDDVILLETLALIFNDNKSILRDKNYLLAANLDYFENPDLSDWAKTFTLTPVRRAIVVNQDYAERQNSQWLSRGINQTDYMTNSYMSYNPFDTVRTCIFLRWENGTPDTAFWMGDLDLSTLALPQISDNSDPDVNLYQIYFTVEDINLDFILADGRSIRSLLKKDNPFYFGRTLVNSQCLTTGIGIIADSGTTPHTLTDEYWGTPSSGTPDLSNLMLYSSDLQNFGGALGAAKAGDYLLAMQPSTAQKTYTLATATSTKFLDYFGNGNYQTSDVTGIQNLSDGGKSGDLSFTLQKSATITNRGGLFITLANPLTDTNGLGLFNCYLIRPYNGAAYQETPTQSRFFKTPSEVDNTGLIWSVFGGDNFINKNYYLIAVDNNVTHSARETNALGFYSYNKSNAMLRSATGAVPLFSFPRAPIGFFLSEDNFDNDQYDYDQCFTPTYPFQVKNVFNPTLPFTTHSGDRLAYSSAAITENMLGGQRLWKFLDSKDLGLDSGDITHMAILKGFTSQNILVVLQPTNVSAQFFDNTSGLVTSSGEINIGNGAILGREGVPYTAYGCSHKWSCVIGRNSNGHECLYWFDSINSVFMRLAEDGCVQISPSIYNMLNINTFLGDISQFTNEDAPADFLGVHGVRDSMNGEYKCTFRLMRKGIVWVAGTYLADTWVKSPTDEVWGFENFPVMYRAKEDTNAVVTDTTKWQRYADYNDGSNQMFTFVWNEADNKWKCFRLYFPCIYGAFNKTFVSGHPTNYNEVFEHNVLPNWAIYYSYTIVDRTNWQTNPDLYTITGTDIQIPLPSPFTPLTAHKKYYVIIDGRTFEIIDIAVDTLIMAQVDDDDLLPTASGTTLNIYVGNATDNYVQVVVNEQNPLFTKLGDISQEISSPLRSMEIKGQQNSITTFEVAVTVPKSSWDKFNNGEAHLQVPNATVGQSITGKWFLVKMIMRWGKKYKLWNTLFGKPIETDKTR